MPHRTHRRHALTPLVLLCLLTTYLVWGTTYYAIRVALRDVPPFLLMGARFAVAGTLLYGFLSLRGAAQPNWRQLRNCTILGALLILGGMGGTALGEETISSGATTVMIATLPIFTLLWQIPQGQRPRREELFAIVLGSAGVLTLSSGAEFTSNWHGTLALLTAIAAWSLGTQLSRSMDLPQGPLAFALEMLMGGLLLIVFSAAIGERPMHAPSPASIWAWLYLVSFGALLAFSAYMYLASQVSPVLANSYVYVNPPIALAVGACFGGEHIAPQTLIAVGLIVCALIVLGWDMSRQNRLVRA